MKVIIIDDEESARKLIETILIDLCPEVKEIYKAKNLKEGVELIKKESPDLVLLDIEMPNNSGLQILNFFENEEVNFQIIFITAYNKYAVDAFKLSATDYLLKPLYPNELKKSVEKALKKSSDLNIKNEFKALKKKLNFISLNTLALEVPNGIIFASYDDIIFFEADGMYTKVYTTDLKYDIVSKPLKFFSEQLKNNDFFFKSHRSYIINLKHIKQYLKHEGGYLVMSNDINIPISKKNKEEFLNTIQISF